MLPIGRAHLVDGGRVENSAFALLEIELGLARLRRCDARLRGGQVLALRLHLRIEEAEHAEPEAS